VLGLLRQGLGLLRQGLALLGQGLRVQRDCWALLRLRLLQARQEPA
jgi:hypothetical protein